jgi:hypothetical protein
MSAIAPAARVHTAARYTSWWMSSPIAPTSIAPRPAVVFSMIPSPSVSWGRHHDQAFLAAGQSSPRRARSPLAVHWRHRASSQKGVVSA